MITIELLALFALMALIFWASRRKNKKDIVRHDVLPNSAEPLANDQGQVQVSVSLQVTRDSYLHDPQNDIYIETPHPNINKRALSLPLPLKEDEKIIRDDSAAKILKVPHDNNGEEERLAGNHRRFIYRCENLGAGRVILTNKSLFLLAECTGKAIRIGLRAIGTPDRNRRESAVLQLYKHDYHYPIDYRVYGVDVQSWWRSIKPKG